MNKKIGNREYVYLTSLQAIFKLELTSVCFIIKHKMTIVNFPKGLDNCVGGQVMSRGLTWENITEAGIEKMPYIQASNSIVIILT